MKKGIIVTLVAILAAFSFTAIAFAAPTYMSVATGGTLARQVVKTIRPKAIIAVACERDLTSGIQDVFPLPVIGVLNERPYGPCFNTRVDINKVEETIKYFLLDEGNNDKNN